MPANVGTAYVTIMPSTKGFAASLSKAGGQAGTSSGNSFNLGFGKALGKLGKVSAVAFGGIATGMGVIGKGAMDAYADFEQLEGGVKKLYGDAWQTVMKNANDAYKTSGMSANKYMEQATSFSSALVNSLGGDVNKAADLTDVAMRSISDNVNVFGSNMGSVTDAFQGFAKQNYTMLDNLKLGYGGTKEEMQRLVKDASKLTDAQKELGLTVDSSSMSFDNIVSAIAVMQQDMKIAGTTFSEAMGTISGSLAMTQSAWENWLAGLGNEKADMGQLTDQLVESFGYLADNVGKRAGVIGSRIVEALPQVFSTIAGALPQVALPILQSAFDTLAISIEGILGNLGIEVPENGFIRWEDVTNGFQGALDAVQEFTDNFTAAFEDTGALDAMSDVSDKISDLWDHLQTLIPKSDEVKDAMGDLGTVMGSTLGDGIVGAIDGIGDLADKLGDFKDHLGEIGDVVGPAAVGIGLFAGALTAIGIAFGVINIGSFAAAIGGLIASLPVVTALTSAWGIATGVAGDAWALLTLAFEASPLGMVVLGITAVVAALALFFGNTETGRKMWESFTKWLGETWENLKSSASEIWGKVTDAISKAWDSAKKAVSDKMGQIKSDLSTKWESAKSTVVNKVTSIKDSITKRFTQIKDTISNKVSSLKDIISKPFRDAKAKIDDVVNGIKGLFPINIGNILSGIRTPHFDIKWESKSILGKTVRWPSGVGVSWYAKGGIFDRPSIIGVGDTSNDKEAVAPVKKLKSYIREAVSDKSAKPPVNVYLNYDASADANDLARGVARAIHAYGF